MQEFFAHPFLGSGELSPPGTFRSGTSSHSQGLPKQSLFHSTLCDPPVHRTCPSFTPAHQSQFSTSSSAARLASFILHAGSSLNIEPAKSESCNAVRSQNSMASFKTCYMVGVSRFGDAVHFIAGSSEQLPFSMDPLGPSSNSSTRVSRTLSAPATPVAPQILVVPRSQQLRVSGESSLNPSTTASRFPAPVFRRDFLVSSLESQSKSLMQTSHS